MSQQHPSSILQHDFNEFKNLNLEFSSPFDIIQIPLHDLKPVFVKQLLEPVLTLILQISSSTTQRKDFIVTTITRLR